MCLRLKISCVFPTTPTSRGHSSRFHHIFIYLMLFPKESYEASSCHIFFLFVCFDLCRRSCFYSNGRESCAWAVIQNLVSMMWLYQWTWCTPVSFSSTRSFQNMTFLHATVFCWMSLFSLVFLCVFVISFLSSIFSRLLRCWLKWSHSQSLVVSNPAPYCCWMAAWLKPHICPNKWLWWGSPLHR